LPKALGYNPSRCCTTALDEYLWRLSKPELQPQFWLYPKGNGLFWCFLLHPFGPPPILACPSSPPHTSLALPFFSMLVACKAFGAALSAAVKDAEDKRMTVASSLGMYPHGRFQTADAKVLRDTCVQTHDAASKMMDIRGQPLARTLAIGLQSPKTMPRFEQGDGYRIFGTCCIHSAVRRSGCNSFQTNSKPAAILADRGLEPGFWRPGLGASDIGWTLRT
jgi:hypothetical protein